MQIRDYFRILRRSWILITAVTLAGLIVGAGATFLTRPIYTAETQLFVAIQGSGSVSELQQGNSFSQARVQSYVKTVQSPAVLQPVIDSLGLQITAHDLAQNVKATTELNTVLINISVNNESPVQASAIAQATASSLIHVVDTLEKPTTGGASPVSLSVIKPATAPPSPTSPNTKMDLIVGLLIGLVAGVALAVLRSTLDTVIRGEEDVRRITDAPVLGGIAFDQEASEMPLLTQAAHQSPRAESFRQLRTNLQFANVSGHAKTVLLTSSLPGEGKSTTAANLAISLAQAGQSVCLIDADLRRPMINEYLGLDRSAGLTTALVGSADVKTLLQPWGDDQLFVLTSGMIPPNPSELLGSTEMSQLVLGLEELFDLVVIDAPPLLPVTDAAVLSQHVGGIVLVIGSHVVKQQDLERSLNALNLVGANILGVVLNRLPSKGPDANTYGYYASTMNKREPAPALPRFEDRTLLDSHAIGIAQAAVRPRPARRFPQSEARKH
ncbi:MULTISPECIES: polysaccharide biosynthesis tyrosine autokinase [unclassified Arthrobacter]|uniref:polysaccharide biosynthesis tyrosine autokinase n=1 Tax=unclassified Arthrobacter TaxID=235627 RepID=UPI001C8640CE|nr:polysaccharide biosynthesis tyrosine autokinase [Arthrobacter sp. MAHUQ-56]MBX7444916.1 polysaccharide biosynthesis tyrosine autokinase [Arthrobacter sp. MAHUQ-56]